MNISTKRDYIFRFTGSANSEQKQPRKVLCRKGILENFTSFTGKHPCLSLFLIKLQVFRTASCLQACKFIKMRPKHKFFPVKIVKFLKTHILKNISDRLVLSEFSHFLEAWPVPAKIWNRGFCYNG